MGEVVKDIEVRSAVVTDLVTASTFVRIDFENKRSSRARSTSQSSLGTEYTVLQYYRLLAEPEGPKYCRRANRFRSREWLYRPICGPGSHLPLTLPYLGSYY